MNSFYRVASLTARVLTYVLASGVEASGLQYVPRTGPAIVTPNHLHFADPPVLGGLFPRPIRFMVKQEAWDAPIGGTIIRWYGAFPVRRGEADVSAYRTALKLLKAGEIVGIFPEGHRSREGQLQRLHPGAIVLANRSGAPIVPVGMWGVRDVLRGPGSFRRFSVRVRVGEPYHPAPARSGDTAALAADLAARIAALLPPEHRPRPLVTGA